MAEARKFSDKSLSDYSSKTGPDGTVGNRKFVIRPWLMQDAALMALNLNLREIADSWTAIGKTWENLRLNWTGKTADEARAFQERVQKVQKDMFGSPAKDGVEASNGVLAHLLSGAHGAAMQYSEAELSVKRRFDDFNDALNGSGPKGDVVPKGHNDNPVAVHYDKHGGVRYDERKTIGFWTGPDGVRHNLLEYEKVPQPQFKKWSEVGPDGKTQWFSGHAIEETWIDDNGKPHQRWVSVERMEWTDDKNKTHVQTYAAPKITPTEPFDRLEELRRPRPSQGPKI